MILLRLAVIFALAATATVRAQSPATAPVRHDRFPLSPANEVLVGAVESPDWIFRAIATMRLEGMTEIEADELLDALRRDSDGRVRAFAVRSIARRPGGVERLAGLDDPDPRVLRVAMLYGVTPDPEAVRTATTRSLRAPSLELRTTGIELAAMLGDPKISAMALRSLELIITNMNQMQASFLSHRLGPACGLSPSTTIPQWRRWFAAGQAGANNGVRPSASTPAPRTDDGENKSMGIHDLQGEAFIRFVSDYLVDLRSRRLELVVCIDTSGSMRPTIDAARAGVERLFAFFSGVTEELRVGIVGYSDVENQLVISRLTTSVADVRGTLWSLTIGGGTEPVADALTAAIENNPWSESARRIVILIGDETYQPESRERIQRLLWNASENGFSINTVKVAQSRIIDPTFPAAWEEVARWGGGHSATLDRPEDLVSLIVTLCIGRGWENEIRSLMEAYFECVP